MKIGVIVAMSKEFNILAREWTFGIRTTEPEERKIHVEMGCRYMVLRPTERDIIYLMQCGIGKVNAAIGAMVLISKECDVIINSGVAGGVGMADQTCNVGSVVIGKDYRYHDVYCGAEEEKGAVQGEPPYYEADIKLLHIARNCLVNPLLRSIYTGDQFVDNKQAMGRIMDDFRNASAVDMESCAMAQVCSKKGIPFISIRTISDFVMDNNVSTYEDFWENVPEMMAADTMGFVNAVLKEYDHER